ncbi:hypothetical protein WJX74_001354 [Apatococcus lobatus]|uniref:Uncharacterized protein n=1 Tax=Apatococcus lobatus TaxID=904363 RepID=A0AAW1RPD7_9CHLO
MPCTASCSGRPFESSSSTSRAAIPPALAAPRHSRRGCRRSSRRSVPAQASAAAFAGDISSFSSASGGLSYETLQQLTSVLGFLIGAGWFAYQFSQTKGDASEGMRECPTCHGSGTVECVCTRWADGDVGCGICGGSGRMVCQSCKGGGTGVPISARMYIQR